MDFLTTYRPTRRTFFKLAGAMLLTRFDLGQSAFAQDGGSEALRIGSVLPVPTGNPAITDTVAAAAQNGATMAEGALSGGPQGSGPALKVLQASSPTAEVATRAAERLIITEDVFAIVGGIGAGQAAALSKICEQQKVLFFNIGSSDDALREQACSEYTFHVEASAAMYLDALTTYFESLGTHTWFIVYTDSAEGKALYQCASAMLGSKQLEEAGNTSIAPGPQAYNDVFDQIRKANPDVILLLLDPADQDFFLGQYEFAKLDFPITGFPSQVAQTRDFYARFLQSAPSAGAGYRATLWDTTLNASGAGELNQRFMGRAGMPMDPAGWAAYMAVKILYEAATATDTVESETLVRYLESSKAHFDVDKGIDVSFRPWNHQLRQPLYIAQLNPDAKLDVVLGDRLALAKVIGQLPEIPNDAADVNTRLDQIGITEGESQCSL